ncbi:MAG: hypothetical protein COV72_05650 [Candidatus Omnitrophica bacterium CG11_big_fil_rev_8_21_14_0_20_42_13]|uniref:Uncharacterized protein n=1 Tax=Candidatus Ghiorseimicrobium undicola TaxID=1974746 RepID=A0A2H0LX13_9BACT|nr:MAG: hypothetical protein COV72_05650 [Candidatus Omnitrophica bacterium CG11_big_fil_rev_8_21_14_0_20_42_13]
MNLSTLQAFQIWCNIFMLSGVIITAAAGFGNFYFGKKITEQKDQKVIEEKKELNIKIESLLKGGDELKLELQPFKDIAKERFPNEDIRNALNRLSEELHNINKQTEKTVFEIKNFSKNNMPSGECETKIQLMTRGENVIPLFSIAVKTQNEAIIKTFEVHGPTIPKMSYDQATKDLTGMRKEFRIMPPGDVTVTIITDKDPGNLDVYIDPLLSQ